jgi:hypothetical protein
MVILDSTPPRPAGSALDSAPPNVEDRDIIATTRLITLAGHHLTEPLKNKTKAQHSKPNGRRALAKPKIWSSRSDVYEP